MHTYSTAATPQTCSKQHNGLSYIPKKELSKPRRSKAEKFFHPKISVLAPQLFSFIFIFVASFWILYYADQTRSNLSQLRINTLWKQQINFSLQ